MVVGAKGSPLQLVLSSVYHIDIPNGNIDKALANKISKNPNIKQIVPIALGDNYKGFRVVGTTKDFLNLYGLELSSGDIFKNSFEVLAGASTGLKLGDTFAASHGFSTNNDDVHDAHLYTVIGILEKSGTVADRLLMTPYESVQKLHADHDHHHGHHGHNHKNDDKHKNLSNEITALLIKVKTPMATMTLPRTLNQEGNILAAVPSYEIAKLSKNFGIGERLVFMLFFAFMGIAVLMIFSNLSSNLVTRQYDLAVMRVLGASPLIIFSIVLFEGILIGFLGALGGVFMGHLIAYMAVINIPSLEAMTIPKDILKPQIQDLYFLGLGLLSGCFAALLPAYKSLRIDIAALLAKGHS